MFAKQNSSSCVALTYTVCFRNCVQTFSPPVGVEPHQCLPAVRECPESYANLEVKELCVHAPPNYRHGKDQRMYRNRFCQLCNGLDSFPASSNNGTYSPN